MSTSGPPEAVREPWEPLPAGSDLPAIPGPREELAGGPAPAEDLPPTAVLPGPPADAPPGRPPHRWGLGAYLLVEAVFLLTSLLLVLPYVGPDNGSPPPAMLLLSLTVPTLLAAGVALLATWLRGNGPRIDLGLRFERADLTRGLAFGCGGLVLTIPAAAVWSRVVGPEANSAVAELFAGQRFPVPLAIGVFLVVWLVAPICEEIVYRGLLWGAVQRHVASRWWTFGLTTLCFALAHFEFTRTPLLLIIAVPIGLARLFTGRLGASIIAHQLNNLLPAVALLLVLLGVPM
ncbi:MAG TPA: CPBP family intramembrane glutamic endopeptidase [Pseudonocardia sp.]|uniref:CPBP family intramembrane glutamic endopeptidase n=1 Tax=Pseudonocardia sp. TaxID=60912 RepID=UPI002C1B53F9|nr:CPBP family intramembrane glutamic endopeptidase [Pseudonocardia sp.]HTF46407.1 CPBP family intramembrane glutamic endopeptidase [Pseudonocardia sp.]